MCPQVACSPAHKPEGTMEVLDWRVSVPSQESVAWRQASQAETEAGFEIFHSAHNGKTT